MPSREELWEMLHKNGAHTKDNMAKYVNLLLVGEGYGATKIAAARKWSCPTISLPMAEYLGMFEPRGTLKVDPQLKDMLPQFVITHAFICELIYGQFIRLNGLQDPRAKRVLGTFYQLAAGLDELLRIAWGDPDGNSSQSSEGLDDLLRSLTSIRTEAEESLCVDG